MDIKPLDDATKTEPEQHHATVWAEYTAQHQRVLEEVLPQGQLMVEKIDPIIIDPLEEIPQGSIERKRRN